MRERVSVNDKDFEIYLSKDDIQGRIWDLGNQITNDYHGKSPVIISILNGAFIFTADLVRYIELPLMIEFVRLSSYHGTSSTGAVKRLMDLNMDIAGRDVLIVEDIVDTGLTLSQFLIDIKAKNPASVAIVSLLRKPEALTHDVHIDYLGFDIPNEFVLGYGLDYDEVGRELPHIYKLV